MAAFKYLPSTIALGALVAIHDQRKQCNEVVACRLRKKADGVDSKNQEKYLVGNLSRKDCVTTSGNHIESLKSGQGSQTKSSNNRSDKGTDEQRTPSDQERGAPFGRETLCYSETQAKLKNWFDNQTNTEIVLPYQQDLLILQWCLQFLIFLVLTPVMVATCCCLDKQIAQCLNCEICKREPQYPSRRVPQYGTTNNDNISDRREQKPKIRTSTKTMVQNPSLQGSLNEQTSPNSDAISSISNVSQVTGPLEQSTISSQHVVKLKGQDGTKQEDQEIIVITKPADLPRDETTEDSNSNVKDEKIVTKPADLPRDKTKEDSNSNVRDEEIGQMQPVIGQLESVTGFRITTQSKMNGGNISHTEEIFDWTMDNQKEVTTNQDAKTKKNTPKLSPQDKQVGNKTSEEDEQPSKSNEQVVTLMRQLNTVQGKLKSKSDLLADVVGKRIPTQSKIDMGPGPSPVARKTWGEDF